MTLDDLDFCLGMFSLAGWGNTGDDVRRMLSYEPGGCFVVSIGGVDVGMVGSIGYGDVGYVGNLIVLPGHRGRGIGATLMRAALDHLEGTGVKSIRLDSVERAIPLYRRLGFREERYSLRFTGVAKRRQTALASAMTEDDLPGVVELDGRIFGLPRARVLERVYEDFPEHCFVAREGDDVLGYIMAKKGDGIHRIGPWICEPRRPELARALLLRLMDGLTGRRLWVGVLEGNPVSVEILRRSGFGSLPSSLRMCRGECTDSGIAESMFSVGGPDKG